MLLRSRQVAVRVAGFTTLVVVSGFWVFLSIFQLGTVPTSNVEAVVAKRFFPNPSAFLNANTQPVTAPVVTEAPQTSTLYEPPHFRTNTDDPISQPLRFRARATPAPVASKSEIPKKLWYKVGPQGMSVEMRQWTESCINNNPAYRLEYMTDHSADDYVKQTFAAHPDIVNTYLSLSVPILKADLLRYLILFAEGGVYSDLDVSCEGTPIEQWVPSEYENDAALVVGWEFDAGWGQNFVRQFATWIIMAKPGLPHMWMVIEDVIQGLHDMAAHNNVTLSGLKHSMVGDVCDVTGPRRFTRSILKSLSSSVEGQIYEQSLSNLRKPRLVGDVLILPGYAFAASTNHYHEKKSLGPVLVTHHYASTWRNELGGELVNQLV